MCQSLEHHPNPLRSAQFAVGDQPDREMHGRHVVEHDDKQPWQLWRICPAGRRLGLGDVLMGGNMPSALMTRKTMQGVLVAAGWLCVTTFGTGAVVAQYDVLTMVAKVWPPATAEVAE